MPGNTIPIRSLLTNTRSKSLYKFLRNGISAFHGISPLKFFGFTSTPQKISGLVSSDLVVPKSFGKYKTDLTKNGRYAISSRNASRTLGLEKNPVIYDADAPYNENLTVLREDAPYTLPSANASPVLSMDPSVYPMREVNLYDDMFWNSEFSPSSPTRFVNNGMNLTKLNTDMYLGQLGFKGSELYGYDTGLDNLRKSLTDKNLRQRFSLVTRNGNNDNSRWDTFLGTMSDGRVVPMSLENYNRLSGVIPSNNIDKNGIEYVSKEAMHKSAKEEAKKDYTKLPTPNSATVDLDTDVPLVMPGSVQSDILQQLPIVNTSQPINDPTGFPLRGRVDQYNDALLERFKQLDPEGFKILHLSAPNTGNQRERLASMSTDTTSSQERYDNRPMSGGVTDQKPKHQLVPRKRGQSASGISYHPAIKGTRIEKTDQGFFLYDNGTKSQIPDSDVQDYLDTFGNEVEYIDKSSTRERKPRGRRKSELSIQREQEKVRRAEQRALKKEQREQKLLSKAWRKANKFNHAPLSKLLVRGTNGQNYYKQMKVVDGKPEIVLRQVVDMSELQKKMDAEKHFDEKVDRAYARDEHNSRYVDKGMDMFLKASISQEESDKLYSLKGRKFEEYRKELIDKYYPLYIEQTSK